jgi:surface polysaccharide O-acyltransferase-like enzyme
MWYGGPAWFLWVLLAFGAIASLLYAWAPGFGVRLGAFLGRLADRPVRVVALLIAVSALVYLPMAAAFRPETWTHVGPFWIQTSRALHYLVYFLAGVGLGAYGRDKGLLAPDGRFARRWPLWLAMAVVSFVAATMAVIAIVSSFAHGGPGLALATFGNLTFVLCCAGWSATALALFLRFATRPRRVVESLGASAYGIYVLHYVCVTWLQYRLLPAGLPGSVKFLIVFAGAVAASWALTAAARRVPPIARVIG